MKYTLKVTETQRKTGRFLYQVLDQDGNIISERRSHRTYIACTIDGTYYFGRLDLIGKSNHGREVRWQQENGIDVTPIAYVTTN